MFVIDPEGYRAYIDTYEAEFQQVSYLLDSVAPTCCGPGLRQTRGAHRRAVVFGDQATALHPKTA